MRYQKPGDIGDGDTVMVFTDPLRIAVLKGKSVETPWVVSKDFRIFMLMTHDKKKKHSFNNPWLAGVIC